MKNPGMKRLIDSDRDVVQAAIEQIEPKLKFDLSNVHVNPAITAAHHHYKIKPKGQIFGGIITLEQDQGTYHIDFLNELDSSRNAILLPIRTPHQPVYTIVIRNRGSGEVGLSINQGNKEEGSDLTYAIGFGEIFDTSNKYPSVDEPLFNNMNVSCLSAGNTTIGVALFV